MQSYTQNANGSITGIPTFETSLVQSGTETSRTFSQYPSFASNYYSPTGTRAFSLNAATNGSYLVGNSYISLYNLAGTDISSNTPFSAIEGVPSDLVDGFYKQNYKFLSKFFSITSDPNKQLFVLPFSYYLSGEQYNVRFSRDVIVYQHVNVNAAENQTFNWPVSISREPARSLIYNTSGYAIPAPTSVPAGSTSFCPIIDAHPGFINITIPKDGFYLEYLLRVNVDSPKYFTPDSLALRIVRGSFARVDTSSSQPSFFITYRGFSYTPLFTREATGYTITLTKSTPQYLSNNTLQLYSNQVYSDMSIQGLINVNNLKSNIVDITNSSNSARGSFVLPPFYMPAGLRVTGNTSFISSSSVTGPYGVNQILTILPYDVATNNTNYLSFEGSGLGPQNAISGKPRYAISTNPSAPNSISNAVTFDITSANNQVVLTGLKPNTTYSGFSLRYYPYLGNSMMESYFENVDLAGVSFTTNAGSQISASINVRNTGFSRAYTITLSNIGTVDSFNNFTTLSVPNNDYSLVLDLVTSDASEQPYIRNTSSSILNYSEAGVLEIPLQQDFLQFTGSTASCVFSISNLEYNVNYFPKVYFKSPSNRSNVIIGNSFIIPSPPAIVTTFRPPTANSYTSSLQLSNFNVYDSLTNIDYSLPDEFRGSLRVVSNPSFGPQLDYGSVEVTGSSQSITIPVNKNIVPNARYNLQAAYNSRPHVSTGWNQYIPTDSSGKRNFTITAGSVTTQRLATAVTQYTGITLGGFAGLTAMLGPNAVMYGSSVLYAYMGVTGILSGSTYANYFSDRSAGNTADSSTSYANDIDIMVKDQTVLNNIVRYIYSLGENPTIYDKYNLYSGPTLGVGITNAALYNSFRGVIALRSSSTPTGSVPMGNIDLTRLMDYGDENADRYFGDSYKAVTVQLSPGTIPFQVVYVPPANIPINFTLAEYAQYNSDFTVNAGTYDGSNIVMPFYQNVQQKVAIYREVIEPKRRWRLISRIAKYLERGFTIFFQSQSQIDSWNNLQSGITEYDPWWINASSSNPKPLNNCPFRVLNTLALLPTVTTFSQPQYIGGDVFQTTNIVGTTVSFGGNVTISQFDYTKYSPLNSIPTNNSGGTLTVSSLDGTIIFGKSVVAAPSFPSDQIVQLNNAYVPPGSTGMKVTYSWDSPTQVGTDTKNFTYTAYDPVLPQITVTPLIHNLVVSIPSGTTFGGSPVSTTQPLVQLVCSSNIGLTFQGNYTSGVTYPANSLVLQTDQLYRLSGASSTGNPINGNGWTRTPYMSYRGVWDPLQTYSVNDYVLAGMTGPMYVCTGNVNGQNPAAFPGGININTGERYAWSNNLENRIIQMPYNSGYTGTVSACIPNETYNVGLQYQIGNTFTRVQQVAQVKTLAENIEIDSIVGEYFLRNIHFQGTSTMLNDGVFVDQTGVTYPVLSAGVTVTPLESTIRYQPQDSLNVGVEDLTSFYRLSYSNVSISATAGITQIGNTTALLTLSDVLSTNTLSTYDSIVIESSKGITSTIVCNVVMGSGLDVENTIISVLVTGLSEGELCNLTAYYLISGSSILIPITTFIPPFTTETSLAFTSSLNTALTTDYFSTLSNFRYNGATLSGVFPAGSTNPLIIVYAYSPTDTQAKFEIVGAVSSDLTSVSFRFPNISNQKFTSGLSVQPSLLTMFDLLYSFTDSSGVAVSYSKNGLTM